MTMHIALRCSAEDRVIGMVQSSAGSPIDADALKRHLDSEDGYAFDTAAIKDGVQLLCPRCANPVVVRAENSDLYLVPGSLRVSIERSTE